MEQFVLPFRGDQYSFGLSFSDGSDGPRPDIDLSCVCFDRQGTVLDYVNSRRLSALDGAIVNDREKSLLPPEGEFMTGTPGDDIIHFFPKKLDPACEVLIFVASAPLQPTTANDLDHSPVLSFSTQYLADTDSTEILHKTAELKKLVSGDRPNQGSLGLGNGHQSLVIATVYLDQPGWTVLYDLTSHQHDSFGMFVPELQQVIHDIWTKMGVALDAARKVVIDPEFKIVTAREGEDRGLNEAGAFKVAVPAAVTKLRLDLGWASFPVPELPEDSEAEAEVEPEIAFQLLFYDVNGEEVQSVSNASPEAPGVKVGRDEPEEKEEDEEEEEAEPEKEEDEEGEEKEEDDGVEKELPPAPKPPRETPFDFIQKDVVFITLAELPKEVRSMVLAVTQYGGGGFKLVKYIKARLVDVSGSATVGAFITETSANTFSEFTIDSKYFDHAAVTQTVMLKLYKEYTQSAFHLFSDYAVSDLQAFVLDTESNKERMKEYLESTKSSKAAEAAATAKSEEEGDEVATDLRPHAWRYATLGLMMPGESMEDAEHDIKNVILFDGKLTAGEERTAAFARVQFANLDTYFGGYVADLKSGTGVYAFASGAMHIGQYLEGKRDGPGLMIFPDASMYEGTFKADKFDGLGQYRYPDGSVYTGSFANGLKHGDGVYWDTAKGCLRGQWSKGILKGTGSYDQPAYRFNGNFVQGVPCGPGTFTLTAHRTLDMDLHAAEHILSEAGPTLIHKVEYFIPDGSGADPELDEDGQVIENDERPPLPAHPKYEGLGMTCDLDIPIKKPDISFPPVEGLPVPVPAVPTFAARTGLVAAKS